MFLQTQSFDDKKPFGSELMIELIQSQWFPSSSRVKGDVTTTNRMVKEEEIPLPMIFLTLTAVSPLRVFFPDSFSLIVYRLSMLWKNGVQAAGPPLLFPLLMKPQEKGGCLRMSFFYPLINFFSYQDIQQFWKLFEQKSSKWTVWWPKKLFKTAVYAIFLFFLERFWFYLFKEMTTILLGLGPRGNLCRILILMHWMRWQRIEKHCY